MATKTFVSGTTITSAWLNDVNTFVYSVVNVKDSQFGALGDNSNNDSAEIQNAIDFAQDQVTNGATLGDSGYAVYIPSGNYIVTSELTITENGITVFSDPGQGAKIFSTATNLFNVGDYTLAKRLNTVTIENLTLASNTLNGTNNCIKLYRTVDANIHNCRIMNFYVGIDCYRASTTHLTRIRWYNGNRTANADAFIQLTGTNEATDAYSPGGGMHITDCEGEGAVFIAGVETYYTDAGVRIKSVDGLYVTQWHMTGCRAAVDIVPDGTATGYVITDAYFTACYFDQPATVTSDSNTFCVNIGGVVATNITKTTGNVNSIYQNIHFNGCYGRGANVVQRVARVQIGDAAAAFFLSGREVRDIQFIGGNWQDGSICAFQIYGAANGAYIEPSSVIIDGVYTEHNNSSGSLGIGSFITASAGNLTVTGCTVNADRAQGDYLILASLSSVGSGDTTTASFVCTGNNFANATTPISRDVMYTSQQGARITIANNAPSGSAQKIDQTWTATTSNATTTTVWDYTIPTAGTAGTIIAEVSGCNTDGSKAINYIITAGFRRISSGASTLTAGTAILSMNPDAMATPPTLDLSTHTIRVRVTGIAATVFTWAVNTRIIQSK